MTWWDVFVKFLRDFKEIIGVIVLLTTVIPAARKWLLKPLEEIRANVSRLEAKVDTMDKKLDGLDDDTANIIGNSLQESHDFYVYKQKWCTATEKARLEDMVHKYHKRGRNHLSDKYLEDIINLPEHPDEKE